MSFHAQRYVETEGGLKGLAFLFSHWQAENLAKRRRKFPKFFFTAIDGYIDRHIITNGLFEKAVVEMMGDIAERTGYTRKLVDVGANIGNHSIGLSDVFDSIDSVEPHPVLFHVLEANRLRNGATHMTSHQFGLADKDGTAVLQVIAENHGLGRVEGQSKVDPSVFALSKDQFDLRYEIQLKDASAFIRRFGEDLRRGMIKIDVEGMEEEILLAIEKEIGEFRPIVAFEWFTRSQAGITESIDRLSDYTVLGIKAVQMSKSLIGRAAAIIVSGRSYELATVDRNNLADFYPLTLLVPNEALAQASERTANQ